MEEEIYLTAEGAQKLHDELTHLAGSARDALAKRLRAAIQEGDLSENADYIKAKEDQAFLEGRIQELEYTLQNAIIIEKKKGKHYIVDIGSHVTVQEGSYPEETFQIVGAKETDPKNGKISNESPIGKALIGKHEGDKVTITTPAGKITMVIIKIE